MNPGETQFIGGFEITYCEFEIIRHLMQFMSRKEVAAKLGKKTNTIATQMRWLYNKLGINKITELLSWAAENGFDHQGNFSPKRPDDIPILKKEPAAKGKKGKKKK